MRIGYGFLQIYIANAIGLAGTVLFVVYALSPKRSVFKGKAGPKNEKTKKRIDMVLKILALLAAAVMTFARLIPLALDIPTALQKEHAAMRAVAAQNSSSANKTGQMDVTVRDEQTGMEYRIHYFGRRVEAGEALSVVILPHSNFAVVERRNEPES